MNVQVPNEEEPTSTSKGTPSATPRKKTNTPNVDINRDAQKERQPRDKNEGPNHTPRWEGQRREHNPNPEKEVPNPERLKFKWVACASLHCEFTHGAVLTSLTKRFEKTQTGQHEPVTPNTQQAHTTPSCTKVAPDWRGTKCVHAVMGCPVL